MFMRLSRLDVYGRTKIILLCFAIDKTNIMGLSQAPRNIITAWRGAEFSPFQPVIKTQKHGFRGLFPPAKQGRPENSLSPGLLACQSISVIGFQRFQPGTLYWNTILLVQCVTRSPAGCLRHFVERQAAGDCGLPIHSSTAKR
jgi:hypothetical protein